MGRRIPTRSQCQPPDVRRTGRKPSRVRPRPQRQDRSDSPKVVEKGGSAIRWKEISSHRPNHGAVRPLAARGEWGRRGEGNTDTPTPPSIRSGCRQGRGRSGSRGKFTEVHNVPLFESVNCRSFLNRLIVPSGAGNLITEQIRSKLWEFDEFRNDI